MSGFEMPMTANILIYKGEKGNYIAHALDFDLTETGRSEGAAIENLRVLLKDYIEDVVNGEHSESLVGDLLFPAEGDLWADYKQARPVKDAPGAVLISLEGFDDEIHCYQSEDTGVGYRRRALIDIRRNPTVTDLPPVQDVITEDEPEERSRWRNWQNIGRGRDAGHAKRLY